MNPQRVAVFYHLLATSGYYSPITFNDASGITRVNPEARLIRDFGDGPESEFWTNQFEKSRKQHRRTMAWIHSLKL